MSEQPENGRIPDDAAARQSGAVSEDVQPVTTDDGPAATAQGVPEGGEPDGIPTRPGEESR